MVDAPAAKRSGTDLGFVIPLADSNGLDGRLPVPVTSIIGRDSEVAAVCGLLRRDGVRLVTLTGPGGVGKTRLALQAAAELEPDFADGVCFVRLAAVANPALVAPTVARVFGVQEGGDRSVAERLAEVLGGRRVLLLLDNFEHLLPAGTFAAGLLAACPGLRLLVTSRAVLRLSGEHGYPVPPLEVPAANASPARAAEAGAVRLFAERAHAADPSFALTAENASAVVAICARLEGLPLAVELAAVKIRLLPPRALLDRLADRLPLLTGGPRDLPARQRTMRDTIAWSHDLLSPAEQALFRRLAVFASGFTLTAAAAVMAGTGHGDGDVFDGVEVLVEQSLVRRVAEVAGEPRFRMLETVREYGIERLTTGGETATARDAHAAYYLTLAEPADPQLLMPGQERWLDLFEAEHANLRAALTWLEQSRQSDHCLRFVAALRWFWYVRGHLSEGRGWMERSLALGDPSPSNERARVVTGLGTLTLYQGDYERASAVFAESLKLCVHLGDRREAAVALLALGLATYATGDYALAAAQTEASLALFREFADPVFASNALENLGEIAHAQGDVNRAKARYEEALALQRATGFTWGAIQSLWGLGNVARAEGDLERAMVFYLESLALAAHHGDRRWIAYILAGVAGVAIAQDRAEHAARLFGAVEALLAMIGAAVLPVDQAAYEHGVAAARAKLGDEGFTSAWHAGRAMPPEQAVAEAGIVASAHATTIVPLAVSSLNGLTGREAQILRQVATGRSTPEIADSLFISARTVSSHLTNIFAKLGVRNRAEAVAYAVRHGLD